ncbi:MAG: ATP-binding protein [Myxococcota bacterium]
MRWSYVRFVVSSVLVFWALSFIALATYALTRSWDRERARYDGVFYVHEVLSAADAGARPAQLAALQPHFRVAFQLADSDSLVEQWGHSPEAGAEAWHHASGLEEWWVVPFEDGESVLLAGPVAPSAPPPGYLPIGVFMATIGLPLLATVLGIRLNRGVALVEQATDAIATGELGARVASDGGPTQELSQRFNAMADRIERLIRSRDELVQAVSHELGSPLSRLRFHLELIDRADVTARAERVHAMTRELDALDELVAELLTFVQADDRPVDQTTFDPAQGLADLAELARLDLPDEHPLTIDVVIPPAVPVFADRKLFLRAVENLLRNAVQHADSHVRIMVEAAPDAVSVRVDDDGPGIPAHLKHRVTQPFIRTHTDRGRATGGAGLGLAIVHRILERHGGRLEIADAPAGGARFVTIWPGPP